MVDNKFLDPIPCTVIAKKIWLPDSTDFYEVVVKQNGAKGLLLCGNGLGPSEGEEFIAKFVKIDHEGKYILVGPFPSPPNIPGGGKIIKFPSPRDEK